MRNKFWQGVLSSQDTASAKRAVTLLMALHFILTSFIATFFVFYLIVYVPKGAVNRDLLTMLQEVLKQDFLIILSGLGFITAENLAQIMLEKAKAQVAGNVAVGSPSADSIKVDNINVKQTLGPKASTTTTTTLPLEPEPEV